MSLKTKVIVGNITNLSDARYCAGMGVDLLSFPVGDGADQISLTTFQEISEWVSGPSFVIETGNGVDQQLLEKVTGLDMVQYLRVRAERLSHLYSPVPKQLIVDVSAATWSEHEIEIVSARPSYLVWHDSNGNVELAERINNQIPVLLSIDGKSTLPADLSEWPLTGIALSGTAEDKPGQKDYEALADILEMLETD